MSIPRVNLRDNGWIEDDENGEYVTFANAQAWVNETKAFMARGLEFWEKQVADAEERGRNDPMSIGRELDLHALEALEKHVRADERQKISQEVADGSLRKVFQGAEDRGYKKSQDEWTAIGIEQWELAWAGGILKARIAARKGFEDACELLGREELTLAEIITVLNGGTIPDPLFHDYDGHNSCTRCGQKAYNSGAEGPCPNHPNK